MAELDPGTDSTVAAMTPDSGTGAPANDQTGTEGGTPATDSGFDETALKTLESLDWTKIDPSKLPQTFNEKFVPKAVFTRNQQSIAEEKRQLAAEKQAIFELARKAIADREKPTGPSPAQVRRDQLMELAAAGDKDALRQAIQLEAQELVQPIQSQTAWNSAAETAKRLEPAVAQHWDEIQNTLNSNPRVAELARVDNFKYAGEVMLALGLEHKANDLARAVAASQNEVTALKAKLSTYEKERAAGLPPSTTRAGTSAGRPVAGEADTITDAAKSAWLESGGRLEDFR